MTTSDTTQNLLDAVDRIGPLIKEHLAEAEPPAVECGL